MKYAQCLLAMVIGLLLGSQPALAFSYGTPVARAQIGASFVMVTSIRSPKFDMSKDCFSAKVWYGEHQVRKDRVQIEMLGRKPVYALRVTADETLQHPVSTVELNSGCGYNFSRTYTIFTQTTDRALPDETSVGATTGSYSSNSSATRSATRASGLRQSALTKEQLAAQQRTLGEVCKTEDPAKTLSAVCNANPNLLSTAQ